MQGHGEDRERRGEADASISLESAFMLRVRKPKAEKAEGRNPKLSRGLACLARSDNHAPNVFAR
jgi:hypothetical protein